MGLVGASTPFVTGRPYTLLQDKSVYSTGAVGVALTSPLKPRVNTVFSGLRAITPPLTVTRQVLLTLYSRLTEAEIYFRSEGNLVHELNFKNPSSLLLSAINESGIAKEVAKDDSFYLCALDNGKVGLYPSFLYTPNALQSLTYAI